MTMKAKELDDLLGELSEGDDGGMPALYDLWTWVRHPDDEDAVVSREIEEKAWAVLAAHKDLVNKIRELKVLLRVPNEEEQETYTEILIQEDQRLLIIKALEAFPLEGEAHEELIACFKGRDA